MAFLRTVPRCSAGKKLRKCLPLPVGFVENVTKPSVQLVQVHDREYTGGNTTADVKPAPPRQIDPLDLKFNDPVAAFKSKTTKELFRAYVVYQLCSVEYLVENNMKQELHAQMENRRWKNHGGGIYVTGRKEVVYYATVSEECQVN